MSMKTTKTPRRDAALRDFIASRNTRNTKLRYESVLVRAFRFIGDKELHRITYTDLVTFLDSLSHLGPNSLHLYAVVLKIFFDWCLMLERLEKNPALRLRAPKVQRRPPTFLTAIEANRLLGCVNRDSLIGKRNYALLTLLLGTGLRLGELLAVRFADFIVGDHGDIYLNILRGKGNKARRVKVPGEVYAAVQDFAVALHPYRIENPHALALCLRLRGCKSWKPGKTGPICRLSFHQVGTIVKRTAERAGIRKRVTPHALRHTCFTLEMLEGAGLLEIKEQAGHEYLGTTQRYLHLLDSMKHNAVDKNPLFLGQHPQLAQERLKRLAVERLERLGASPKLIETVREELNLGPRSAPTCIDPDCWMPLREAVEALNHLSRTARVTRRAILDSTIKRLQRNGQMWVWRDHVLELVEDFLSLREAARVFGVNERTLRRWVSDGRLVRDRDAKAWGGKWVIRCSSLKALIKKHNVTDRSLVVEGAGS
jgi:integrase